MTSCEPLDEPRSTVRWKHGAMPVVGLTGGIGSGKSEVAGMLAGAGLRVIDADSMGHELLADPGVQNRLVDRFGEVVLTTRSIDSDGPPRIDRTALAAIVFSEDRARRDLEEIVHPLMRRRFLEAVAREATQSDPRPVVLDAAILLEAGWDDLCDVVVFVDSPRAVRMRRVAAQRGWPAEAFEARERAQWPCDLKRRRAGIVITNDGEIDSLRREVDRLACRLLESSSAPEQAPVRTEAAEGLLPFPGRQAPGAVLPGGRKNA
jgi:dephospho-CoA kinase